MIGDGACKEKKFLFWKLNNKMENDFIPVNIPLLDGKELEYVTECIETGWISSEGAYVQEFEEKIAKETSRKYGIAVANGSAALDVAVAALKIGVGDEVIMPAHTIISCAASVVRSGAKPVLVDSEPLTWNMDVEQIEKKITSKTKAIMAVHLYGLPVAMDTILSIAKKYKLLVIEDAAQMLGQTYNGQPCGMFGDISTFSFYPNKHITTGEGGMCLTNDVQLAERCRSFRNLCFQTHQRFVHEELGWNYRMSNLQAALGVAQTEMLDQHIKMKRYVGQLYNDALSCIPGIQLPPVKTDYSDNIYWVFGIVLKDTLGFDSVNIMQKLKENGVGSRPFFWPIHEQPVFHKMGLFAGETFPVAEMLGRKGFYIPSGLGINELQINRTISVLKRLLK